VLTFNVGDLGCGVGVRKFSLEADLVSDSGLVKTDRRLTEARVVIRRPTTLTVPCASGAYLAVDGLVCKVGVVFATTLGVGLPKHSFGNIKFLETANASAGRLTSV